MIQGDAPESRRLAALQRYDILGAPQLNDFDDITRLAAIACDTPIALITLVGDTRQWFLSHHGWDEVETERAVSFCALTMEQDVMCVPDARADERFASNRLVVGHPGIRFYVGVPIVTPDGYKIGTVCAIDQVARQLEPEQHEALRLLSRLVIERLEVRRLEREQSLKDAVDRAVDGVAVVEPDGSVVFANRILEDLTGQAGQAGLAGASIWEHLDDPDKDLAEHFVDLAATGASDASIRTTIGKRGLPVQVAVVPLQFRGSTCLQLTVRDVSHQVELERSEQSAWKLFQGFIDQIPAIAYVKDRHGRHVVVNRHYAELTRRTSRELIGLRAVDVFPEAAARIGAAEEAALSSGLARLEDEPIPLDDSVRTYRLLIFPVTFEGEQMVGGIYLDVSAGQTTRAALADAQQLFRTVAENLAVHLWLADADLSAVTYSNPAYERIFGESVDELYRDAKSYLKWVHPDDRSAVEAGHWPGSPHTETEFRIIRPDGIVRTLRSRTFSVPGARGPAHIAGITQDITDEREAAQRVAEAVHAHEEMMSALPLGFVALDQTWHYTAVNDAAAAIFGRQPADLLGKHIWTEFPEGVGQPFYNVYMRVMRERTPQSFELRFPPWDRWFVNWVLPTAEGICIFFEETTARERLVRDFETMSRYLDLANLVVLSPGNHSVHRWSQEAQSLYGFTAAEAKGREVDALLRTRFDTPPEAVRHHLDLHGTWEGTVARRAKDGAELTLTTRRTLVRDAEGTPTAVVETSSDITELTRLVRERDALRAQVTQSGRLDALGQLAGGIAHDFNNLLAVVQANLGFALDGDALPPQTRADLDEARRAAERASALTHQLLLFARQSQADFQRVDLNAIVFELSSMLRRLIGGHITLETALEPELPAILADPVRVEQIIVNLVVNARDALPDGGTIVITTASADPEDGADADDPPGGLVRLTVSDNGTGMSPDVQARAFEPFFTTKSVGRGTGLGLSTVYGAATEAGGTVELRSPPSWGPRCA